MSEQGWAILRHSLLSGYADLTRRLTARLGSRELAQDALHDTYLRIEREGDLEPVRRPDAFLMRMALNSASNRRRSDARLIPESEGRAILDSLIDEMPDPERTAISRSEIERLRIVLAELPERRRAIFMAAWGEGQSRQEIADRFGLAVRTVKHEITLARHYCAARLAGHENNVLPFRPRQLSSLDEGHEQQGGDALTPDTIQP